MPRAIYVDSGPLPDGVATNASLVSDGADLPLPPWDVFRGDSSRDLDDLTDAQLDDFRERAVPTPAAVAQDPPVLSDEARFDVPVTMISSTFTRDKVEAAIEAGVPYFAEIPRLAHFTPVELPTGHWPQLTKPEQLAEVILDAL